MNAPCIVQDFFARTACPKQKHIDFLLQRDIPIAALANDPDGAGWPIGVAKVEKVGRRFDFLEDGSNAVVVVARDLDGEPADLVAWLPTEGWFGAWLGGVPLLGIQTLLAPRLGAPLRVFLDVLGWLRAGREGVAVLDRRTALRALEGVTVAAASVDDGLQLERLLTHPKPRIVIPNAKLEREAA